MHLTPRHEHTTDVDELSDRQLVAFVMDSLTAPPARAADSFVLHAPLELMARAALLPAVDPTRRHETRRRIAEIASAWTKLAPHVLPPTDGPTSSLPAAIAAGDPGAADRALLELATHQHIDGLVTAANEALLAHLGGAGHLAIFIDQLTRLDRAPQAAIASGRALVRDLALHPDWVINWIDTTSRAAAHSGSNFVDVLADPPSLELSSNFIYPTMHLVDANGLAAELLTVPSQSIPLDEARRQLLRVAAMSMLQDDPAHAPYGWSHCLTMPQATLAVARRAADPRRAIAIAATYVLGFRATLSNTALDLRWRPSRPGNHGRLLEAECHDAVAQAWHTSNPPRVERELAAHAAAHPDAHLAKYTLACFHAAHADPEAAPLFRAAATRLAIWWRDTDTELAPLEEGTDE